MSKQNLNLLLINKENKMDNMEKTIVETGESIAVSAEVEAQSTELIPLTSASLQHFKPERQEAILQLAQKIDAREIDKIMAYGQSPLERSFEQAGKILQEEEGSEADQQVIKQVMELSKIANEKYDEFNLVLKEPNIFQKLLLKISNAAKQQREDELKVKAITNYRLLEQLVTSCNEWIETLQDGYRKIYTSAIADKQYCRELEEYIVAGHIAEERISQELLQVKEQWEVSGLQEVKDEYDMLQEGLDTFRTVLLNLEKSRAIFAVSLAQLYLQSKANKNIQISVRTQRANSMALAAQQLRNAVLDAKNRGALEGQKSITKLNDELIKKVAQNSKLTSEESEKILLNGVYTVESALIAAKTVIEGCQNIQKAREERNTVIAGEMQKLQGLFDELSPFVNEIKQNKENGSDENSTKPEGLTF